MRPYAFEAPKRLSRLAGQSSPWVQARNGSPRRRWTCPSGIVWAPRNIPPPPARHVVGCLEFEVVCSEAPPIPASASADGPNGPWGKSQGASRRSFSASPRWTAGAAPRTTGRRATQSSPNTVSPLFLKKRTSGSVVGSCAVVAARVDTARATVVDGKARSLHDDRFRFFGH